MAKSGSASDAATVEFHHKISTIEDIAVDVQNNAIATPLKEFATIMSAINDAIEGYTTHQTFSIGAVDVHITPALAEINWSMGEITAATNRLQALGNTLAKSKNAKVSAASALAKLEASGKPDKDNKATDLVSRTSSAVESLTQELKVTIRILCGVELNRILIHCCTTLAKATMQFANAMESNEKKMSQAWLMAANGLKTGTEDKPASVVWNSTTTRLAMYGVDLKDSWVNRFDVAELDSSSNI